MNTHEQLDREHEGAVISSDRSFGLVFAAVFAIVAAMRAWKGAPDAIAWLAGAVAFALVAALLPAALAPFNRAWARFGLLLNRIVTPAVMLLLYVVAIVPMGALLRLARKDLLRLRRDPGAATYWQDHDTTPRARERMRDQF